MDKRAVGLSAAQERALFQVRLIQESNAALSRYEATGQLQDAAILAPTINTAWLALGAALQFARPLVNSIEQLPKKFEYGGLIFRVVYPPEGLAQLIEPSTEIVLTAGLIGWVDPMKVTPLAATTSPPAQPQPREKP